MQSVSTEAHLYELAPTILENYSTQFDAYLVPKPPAPHNTFATNYSQSTRVFYAKFFNCDFSLNQQLHEEPVRMAHSSSQKLG